MSPNRSRSRERLAAFLDEQLPKIQRAWAESWGTFAAGCGWIGGRHDAVLHRWIHEFVNAFKVALRRHAKSTRLESAEGDFIRVALPDVPSPLAIACLVHLRGWFIAYCDQEGHPPGKDERRTFNVLVDHCLSDLAHRVHEDSERRERFVDMLAHDLRSPLATVVLGVSAIMDGGPLSERQRLSGIRVSHAAARMGSMIDDLFAFTRLHAGRGVQRSPFDLDHLSRRLADESKASHPGRSVIVESRGDCRGQWDEGRIARVVQNLLENALANSPPDSVVRISIDGEATDRVQLSIANAGEPIPVEDLSRIFDPFVRSRSRASSQGGTGLGLSIVQEFVAAHGGATHVSSSSEQGTTFRIDLPRGPKSPPREQQVAVDRPSQNPT